MSVSSSERQGNHGSWLGVVGPTGPVVSADGRFVVFWSYATTLTPNDTNRARDAILRDRAQGITKRISKSSTGAQPNNRSYGGSVTRDGRFVAFYSEATNLVTPDDNRSPDVFMRDRSPQQTLSPLAVGRRALPDHDWICGVRPRLWAPVDTTCHPAAPRFPFGGCVC